MRRMRVATTKFVTLLLTVLAAVVQVQGQGNFAPSFEPTPRPSTTSEYATESPTGAQTITHNPDWTEAQLISVVVGSVLGLAAVVLAVYCAYARGCCEEGPKISGRYNELPGSPVAPTQHSPLLSADKP